MSKNVRLDVYTFSLRKRNSRESFKLKNFDNQGADFFSLFREYLGEIETKIHQHDKYFKTIKLKSGNLQIDSGRRIIRGMVESGPFGREEDIVGISTGRLNYRKKKEDTIHQPFYFLLWVPEEFDKGFLILQRLGVSGIRNVFQATLKTFFQERYQDLLIDFRAFLDQEIARQFIEHGNYEKVTLIKNGLPSDLADQYGLTQYAEESSEYQLKLELIAPNGFRKRWLNKAGTRFLDDPHAVFFEADLIKNLGFDESNPHTVSVTSRYNDQTRTIDLSETGKFKPSYLVTDLCEWGDDGYPTFSSLDTAAINLLESFGVQSG